MPEMPMSAMSTLNWAHEGDGGLADDGAVTRAHDATGNEQLAIRVVAEDGCHVQVVGDDTQAAVLHQLVRNRLGSGADVDDQRAAIRHGLGHRLRDAPLGAVIEPLALVVGDVFGGRARHAHAAMKARQQAAFGQQAHVATHGLQRDAQMFGQGFNGNAAVLSNLLYQADLSWMKLHLKRI